MPTPRKLAPALLLLCPILPAQTRKHPDPTPPALAAPLPITRVSLYKNGVGFFEHSGRVTGTQSVTIDFTTAQLNDVLQSLTAIDLGGGRIAGAAYNSTTPFDQQLKSLPLALGEDADSTAFYNSIRGARVEVHAPGISITGRLLSIEIRTVSKPATADDTPVPPAAEKRFLTVVSDAGSVRTFELTAATEVRLLDAALHADVARYLELLAGTRSSGLRHLTLLDRAPDAALTPRDLRVSYISEVPVWKSTYRLLFTGPSSASASRQTATLQGWSVVDNTTGSDWLNVQLSLIAGAPQSFIQPISTPYYARRPEIPLPQEAQLTPQTHASGDPTQPPSVRGTITDPSGAVIPNARVVVTDSTNGQRFTGVTGSDGAFEIAVAQPGQYTVQAEAPGFQTAQSSVAVNGPSELSLTLNVGASTETVSVNAESAAAPMVAGVAGMGSNGGPELRNKLQGSYRMARPAGAMGGVMGGIGIAPPAPYEQAAATSITPETTTRAFDDFFAYNIAQPITIRKNESALVPILQTKIDAERVTLWSPQQPTPLRALWITNTSNLTLDRGSFTIVEDGAFGGEGLLEPIHPAERRLLSYAADQAVRVSTDYAHDTRRVEHISISKGVLKESTVEVAEVEYLVRNAAPEPRTVIVEQPVRPGWTLDSASGNSSDPKPAETTPTAYRFRVETHPAETVRLHLGERHTLNQFYQLLNTSDDQLTLILRNANASPALLARLEPVFAAKRAVSTLDQEISSKQNDLNSIGNDQKRLRDNLAALKGSAEERTLAKRYTAELNTQEDQLTALNKDLATLRGQRAAAQLDLEGKLQSLDLDEAI